MELYHHGIKGMKWGVRRFQNKDGSLTGAGRKRYSDNSDLARQKAAVDRARKSRKMAKKTYDKAANLYSNVPLASNKAKMKAAKAEFDAKNADYKLKKFDYDTNKETARIRDNDVKFDNKSKHRLRLEEQYKKMGLSAEEAQAAANNRIRTEKLLAASATLTVAACAAYVTNKKLKNKIDGIIESGQTLQRVEMTDTGGKVHSMFYAASGKHDSQRYKNLLGMTRQTQNGKAYLMKMEATSDIKVASRDNAAKIFGDLYKNDPDFRSSVKKHVGEHFTGKNTANVDNLSDRNIKKLYENFNANIMNIRESKTGADKKFYDKMKAAGYGAMQDINDMKYSGYNAKNPLIIFGDVDKNIMVKSFDRIDEDLTAKGTKELLKAYTERFVTSSAEKAGAAAAVGLTGAAAATYVSNPVDYRKEATTNKRDAHRKRG